ncbi:MAG: hypothetical protein WDA16_02405 [Candidatus Thermoplasmatota archaeon]
MAPDPPTPEKRDTGSLQKVLEVWVDSDSKVRLLVFFRQNPGVIETLEGLAQRLAIPVEQLTQEVRAHVEIGLLHSRDMAGGKTVYFFDRERWQELSDLLTAAIEKRGSGAAT